MAGGPSRLKPVSLLNTVVGSSTQIQRVEPTRRATERCRRNVQCRQATSLVSTSTNRRSVLWGSMYDEPWELESLRRSLVMCAPEGPATSLTNGDASRLISRLQAAEDELEMLRSGVAVLLHRTTPVPRANAQLRLFCVDLGRLLTASTSSEG